LALGPWCTPGARPPGRGATLELVRGRAGEARCPSVPPQLLLVLVLVLLEQELLLVHSFQVLLLLLLLHLLLVLLLQGRRCNGGPPPGRPRERTGWPHCYLGGGLGRFQEAELPHSLSLGSGRVNGGGLSLSGPCHSGQL